MRLRRARFLALCVLALAGAPTRGSAARAQSAPTETFTAKFLALLPEDLKAKFLEFVPPSPETERRLLSDLELGNQTGYPERFRRGLLLKILDNPAPGAVQFTLEQLPKESRYVRELAISI